MRFLRNLSILILPFLAMVIINEIARPSIKEDPYSVSGITAMNSSSGFSDKCTWICHNNTGYCLDNHVRFLEPYNKYTNVLYFGAIGMLQATGNYGLANIVFLVVLFPFLIWFFLIKSIKIQEKINKIKKEQ